MRRVVAYVVEAKPGERECGDAVVVREEGERCLFAIIDALGHGPSAADVARTAVKHLEGVAIEGGVLRVANSLHGALRGTRGAAAMLCILEGSRLQGCGVGNVGLRSLGSKVPALLTPGILGATLGKVRHFEAVLQAGDRLVLFSDGLPPSMDFGLCKGLTAQAACRALMDAYRRAHDDSTVMVLDLMASL